MADKVIQTIVRYKPDDQSNQATIKSGDAVAASINRVAEEAKGLNELNVGGQAVKNLTSSFEAQRERLAALRTEQQAFRNDLNSSIPEIEKETKAVKNLNTEFDRLAASERKRVSSFDSVNPVADVTGGGTGDTGGASGGVGAGIRLAGSKLRALPSIQLGGGLSTDAIANIVRLGGSVTELAEKAGITTSQLATMGVATAALGVAASRELRHPGCPATCSAARPDSRCSSNSIVQCRFDKTSACSADESARQAGTACRP